MRNQAKKIENYFYLPNPSLRTYLGRVESGQPDVFTTPWIKSESNESKCKELQHILSEWMPHLEALKTQWPSLYEFEKDLAAKVGPMSVQKPLHERILDIESYFTDILRPGVPISTEALAATVKQFGGIRGIRPRSRDNTVSRMKLSTNSGCPWFSKRRTVLNKMRHSKLVSEGVLDFYDAEYYFDRDSYKGLAAVLGWRGQEGGPNVEDVKQRVVWMFPFMVNVYELTVYQPLIEAAQRRNCVPAWVSMEAVDQHITKLFDTKVKTDPIVCTDFTKFDQHFNEHMQSAARDVLSALLTSSRPGTDWLEEVFPIKYHIPLVADEETVFGRDWRLHGMGSGSGGTNADETLAHASLQHEAALKAHQMLNPYSMCLGDDGILTYPGIHVDDVIESYTSHGLDMNSDKQYVSEHDCTYLRRWHHEEFRENGICVGVYSTARALGRLCMQERYYDPESWGAKMVALRELSILENCKHHPLKEEFVDFCMKRDKFRLGKLIPGFLENISLEANKAMELMPDFLGYTKSLQGNPAAGIDSWWIVKYLKSL